MKYEYDEMKLTQRHNIIEPDLAGGLMWLCKDCEITDRGPVYGWNQSDLSSANRNPFICRHKGIPLNNQIAATTTIIITTKTTSSTNKGQRLHQYEQTIGSAEPESCASMISIKDSHWFLQKTYSNKVVHTIGILLGSIRFINSEVKCTDMKKYTIHRHHIGLNTKSAIGDSNHGWNICFMLIFVSISLYAEDIQMLMAALAQGWEGETTRRR